MEPPRDDGRSAGSSPTAPTPPHLSWHWPVGCALTVLYISLLPFDFSYTAFYRPIWDGFGSLRFRSTTPDDVTANLLVYLPVGLVLGLLAMRRQCGSFISVVAATILGATLSILVEALQTGLVSRVASCTDILLNGVGAAIGACLGVGLSGRIRTAMAQVRSELADLPFTTAASLLTLGLFLYDLVPFDFVMTTDALHTSFGRAHWSLMSTHATTTEAPSFAALAHQLTGAGWFAVLGYLLALGGRERGIPAVMSLGSALKDGLILVALVEFMRLFTRSHTFDAAAMLIGSFGVVFGAWCAVFMIDSLTGSSWRRRPSLAVPTGIVAILVLFQVALLFAPCVNSQGVLFSSDRVWTPYQLPFESLWRQGRSIAMGEMLADLMTYGTLTLTLAVLLRRLRIPHAWRWAAIVATLAAITSEGLYAACLAKRLDCTTALLALSAAGLVRHAHGTVLDSAVVTGRRPNRGTGAS